MWDLGVRLEWGNQPRHWRLRGRPVPYTGYIHIYCMKILQAMYIHPCTYILHEDPSGYVHSPLYIYTAWRSFRLCTFTTVRCSQVPTSYPENEALTTTRLFSELHTEQIGSTVCWETGEKIYKPVVGLLHERCAQCILVVYLKWGTYTHVYMYHSVFTLAAFLKSTMVSTVPEGWSSTWISLYGIDGSAWLYFPTVYYSILSM